MAWLQITTRRPRQKWSSACQHNGPKHANECISRLTMLLDGFRCDWLDVCVFVWALCTVYCAWCAEDVMHEQRTNDANALYHRIKFPEEHKNQGMMNVTPMPLNLNLVCCQCITIHACITWLHRWSPMTFSFEKWDCFRMRNTMT